MSIPLTHGLSALVDAEDIPRLSVYHWYAKCAHGRWRAARREESWEGGRRRARTVYMHRFILDAPPGVLVSHLNRDGLDNRRANLCSGTPQEDAALRGRNSNNRSGYRGVAWYAPTGKWRAVIHVGGRQVHLGYFATPGEAARAYDDKARELFGEGADQNSPGEEREG